ncbi:MAG: hypothetical protein ACE5GQ_09260 [Nitrospinales bacterium]
MKPIDNIVPKISDVSIVLIGKFNPSIFHPLWYQAQKLIRPEEADNATLGLAHPEISQFSTDWFRMEVTRDRFFISTHNKAQYDALRDLVQGTFEILCHTPMNQMGINRGLHFEMASNELELLWNRLAPGTVLESIVSEPKLKTIILHGKRDDSESRGHIGIQMAPSAKITNGIYIHINDHFEVEDEKQGAEKLIDILKAQWGESEKRAEKISNNVLRVVKNGR